LGRLKSRLMRTSWRLRGSRWALLATEPQMRAFHFTVWTEVGNGKESARVIQSVSQLALMAL
jgi:hypothetical protein